MLNFIATINKLLILIDIDGTLIHPGLTPRYALAEAIHQHTEQRIEFTVPQLAGMTDPLIVKNALDFLNIPVQNRDGLPECILETYLEILALRYPKAADRQLYPGAIDLLDYLQDQPVRLGLITGNQERGAMIKLKPFDLVQYFSMGVFSSDHPDRDQLPPIALTKCRCLYSEDYRPEQVVIIGDTVRDVWCAHRNGMRAIAVVRHADRRAAIRAENPDLIVDHFMDITPIIDYLSSRI